MKLISLNRVRLALGGLLVAAAMPGFGQSTAMANGETLRIQYIGGSTANYPGIIAERKGFCEKRGFKCELKAINAGPLALQALVGKSVDVALTGTDTAVANFVGGGDLLIVATLRQDNPFIVVARSDVSLPNKAKGYPAVMQDMKGKIVGVTGRGASVETNFHALLTGAGMQATDVTYVGVGGPATAYQALTVGKQIDILVMFEPIGTLCTFNKNCDVVLDLSKGVGPKMITDMNGSMIALLMRREMVESNPKLARAYVAAMSDAVKWARDPANFEEVVKIYEGIVSFGSAPNGKDMLRSMMKSDLQSSSPGMETSRPALKAIVDFTVANKTIPAPIDHMRLVWKDAP
ncbi:MAG: ABC transporter substrate-binding protein [Burkholderiaceae bacterium]|nr:ABC transporter substrate-binding protein [Burkholderiaceae bacterium]